MSLGELQELVKSIHELRDFQRELSRDTHHAVQALATNTEQALKRSADERDKAIRKLAGEWSSQWGQLVEALVEPGLVKQFRTRGIDITQSNQRMEGIDKQGRQLEIDVLLVNGDTVVAIEVKTKCKVDDIDYHEEKLARFKEAFTQYTGKKVLGGIAAVTFDSDCHRYAFKRGLFALKPIEGIATILNNTDFIPKEY